MSKNAMAGAVTLCGVGLCMIGGAMLMQNGAQAHANSVVGALPVAAAVASTATAQAGGEPTIVWYGTYGGMYGSSVGGALLRSWSDGTVEMKKISYFASSTGDACNTNTPCSSPWLVISSPSAGYRAAADINADEKVDGADLTMILGNWGDAPRVPFPPSDCPLNLVNP
ncbi:MAG: hypothetical protein RL591_418 [Planctomycetota bacterium]